MTEDLKNWTPRPRPERKVLDGRYIRLEPLETARHGDGLFAASSVPDAEDRFRWLFEVPPVTRSALDSWLEKVVTGDDPIFYAVIDKATGKVAGRQALMRIDPVHGSAEIGNIYWGPLVSRKPAATEAHYLLMRYVFDELGYRRWEWKCNNNNEPSKRAAERFGFKFEGVFRQHYVQKGKNRDSAWYSIIDKEWPAIRQAYEGWLNPSNFDSDGQQKRRLEDFLQQNSA